MIAYAIRILASIILVAFMVILGDAVIDAAPHPPLALRLGGLLILGVILLAIWIR